MLRERKNLQYLTGNKSNNRKDPARDVFAILVERNSAPNGRTRDSDGRSHAPPRYLDARFKFIYSKKKEETHITFYEKVVKAMKTASNFVAKPKRVISVATARDWLKELFRKRVLENGKLVLNDKYTSLYPHKSDACGDCERMKSDLKSGANELMRHRQKGDWGTPLHSAAEVAVKIDMKDIQSGLESHLKDAKEASDHYKDNTPRRSCTVQRIKYGLDEVARHLYATL